jgi:CheY-like chemotaxis protein
MDKQPKILIVDDDPDFVEATVRVLKTKPYQIVVANDGKEGIRKIRSENPDLILLDIMMPEKDGYAVADEISKDSAISEIPILALTSVIESLGQPPFPFKISEYLQKTIKPTDLLERIDKHLKELGFFANQSKTPNFFP